MANKENRSVPLQGYLTLAKKGLLSTLVVRISHKVSTGGREALQPPTPGRVGINMARGYINKMMVDMPGPPRVSKVKEEPEPTAFRRDFAAETLLNRMGTPCQDCS